jgi:hypothetical protein
MLEGAGKKTLCAEGSFVFFPFSLMAHEDEFDEEEISYKLDYRFHVDAWAPIVADLTLTSRHGTEYSLHAPYDLVHLPLFACDLLLAKCDAHLPQLDTLRSQVDKILDKDAGAFFFKLSSRSAKDVYPLQIHTFDDLWARCIESERIQEDVELYMADVAAGQDCNIFLALQPWRTERMREYRCFVKAGELLCMTDIGDGRWTADEACTLLGPNLEHLIHAICRHPQLPQLSTCSLDIYIWRDNVDDDDAVYFQEPNELDANLDTMGYTWDELVRTHGLRRA